jgi:hypothetical protein
MHPMATDDTCSRELSYECAAAPTLSRSPVEAGHGIEYMADHLRHKNIQNTRIYAQTTNPLREEVFRKLERHPKIVRLA